jgi:vitamin B12 transporter
MRATLALLILCGSTAAFAEEPAARSDGAAVDLASIVVTGAALPVAREKIGNALTVIEGDAIEAQKQAYLLDVLREVPGVSVNQTGAFGGPAQIRIRGAEGNHVLVLIDGIEVMTESSGEFDFSSLLANNIERVEVLRGPQSGLYGSNALAGVINVITKGGDGPVLDAAAEYGSFDTKFGRATATVGDRQTFLTASANYRETDGISTAANGTEPDGDRNFTGYLKGGAALGPIARIDGSLRYVDKHSELDGFDFSGGPSQGLAVDDDSYANTRDWSGGLAVTLTPTDRWRTVASVAFHDGESVGGAGGIDTYGDKGDRLKLAARSSYGFDTGQATHTLTAFVEHEEEGYRNTFPTDPTQEPRLERDMLGFGAEYRLDLFDRVFLRGAVRHDDNRAFADVTTFSIAGAFVVGNGTRLHASYGTGVTNPTFFEQFGFVPGDFVGNPDLLPEKAKGFDFGIEQHFLDNKGLIDVTYFNSKLENEIISIYPSVENDIGKSKREGVEVTARFNLGSISFGGSYTYTDADDPDGTREVRRPRHQASADVTGRFGPDGRASFSTGLIYNGRMLDNDFRDYFNNGFVTEKSPLESFTIVRLAAAYRVTDQIEVFGRIENAFDEDYQQNISYGAPGRAVYGGVRVVVP